jgi:hypothetical protein
MVFFSLAVFSVFSTSVTSNQSFTVYNSEVSNLLYYMPATFWIALFGFGGLFLFLLIKGSKSKLSYAIMFLCILMILEMFFGYPYLIEPNARFIDSYVHGQVSRAINVNGHLTSAFNYEGYPISFIFVSVLTQLSGVSLDFWLHILPVLFVLGFFIFLAYSVLSLTKRPDIAIVATLIYGLSTYFLPFHFSPQLCCWLLFFALIGLLAQDIQSDSAVSFWSARSLVVVLLLIFLAIGITHPGTEFVVVLVLFFFIVFHKQIWRRPKVTLGIFLFVVILYAAWAFFFASSYYLYVIKSFKGAFESVLSDFSNSVVNIPFVAKYPLEVTIMRIKGRFLYVLVGITGLVDYF